MYTIYKEEREEGEEGEEGKKGKKRGEKRTQHVRCKFYKHSTKKAMVIVPNARELAAIAKPRKGGTVGFAGKRKQDCRGRNFSRKSGDAMVLWVWHTFYNAVIVNGVRQSGAVLRAVV